MRSKKETQTKLMHSIRPAFFTSSSEQEESFSAFLEKKKNKSINAKFLLSKTENYCFEKFQESFAPDIPLMKEIISREASNSQCFVFYNGASNAIKFLRMVISIYYKEEMHELDPEAIKPNIVFGRLKRESLSPQRFLENTLDQKESSYLFNSAYDLKESAVFDHEASIAKNLLAASFLLHDGQFGETGWLLFQRNKSMNVRVNQELQFLRTVLEKFFIKKGLSEFPIDKLLKYYLQYKTHLQSQLLQFIVSKEAFNELGYYCYAGGVPVVEDSGLFLQELYEELKKQDVSAWEEVVTNTLNKAYEDNKLYHLANRPHSPAELNMGKSVGKVNCYDFLQVRFLVTNPDFYTSNKLVINEYYRSDESYNRAKELKKNLKELIQPFLVQKASPSATVPLG